MTSTNAEDSYKKNKQHILFNAYKLPILKWNGQIPNFNYRDIQKQIPTLQNLSNRS